MTDSPPDARRPIPNYNARWRRTPKSSWSLVHWFVNGTPACGTPAPQNEAFLLDIQPEPVLTCRACQRQYRLGWRPPQDGAVYRAMGHEGGK